MMWLTDFTLLVVIKFTVVFYVFFQIVKSLFNWLNDDSHVPERLRRSYFTISNKSVHERIAELNEKMSFYKITPDSGNEVMVEIFRHLSSLMQKIAIMKIQQALYDIVDSNNPADSYDIIVELDHFEHKMLVNLGNHQFNVQQAAYVLIGMIPERSFSGSYRCCYKVHFSKVKSEVKDSN